MEARSQPVPIVKSEAVATAIPEHYESLHDLRALEANLRVTCTVCGNSDVFDRETLIVNSKVRQTSTKLADLEERWRCEQGRCERSPVILTPAMPTADPVELRRRLARTILLNLALRVLHDNLSRTKREVVEGPEIRLALRVLHPYVRDESLLREYWNEATCLDKKLWGGSNRAYVWIVNRIMQNGHTIYAELR